MRRLRERARDRSELPSLDQLALVFCDEGWCLPGDARTMPNVPPDAPIGEAEWRRQAGFAVAASALDERREAVENLLRSLGGSPDPQAGEWACTVRQVAAHVDQQRADPQADRSSPAELPPDWNMLLDSVLAVLPQELRSEPKDPDADPLAEAGFLPTEDGRLLSASDPVQIFFQPRRGSDDAADFVDSVPESLKPRIAFLHHDVRTHEGPQRRRTGIQKFLDGRFVQSFRREDLLREVIVPSLSQLPAAHDSAEAAVCADALAWTLEVIGPEEAEGLLPQLARLPVACTGGWFAMGEAVFGPGWAGRSGDHLKTLADAVPDEDGGKLLERALLPPGDDRWFPQGDGHGAGVGDARRIELANRADQFARAGVVDGLRLEASEGTRYRMSRSDPRLPGNAPASVPQQAWDDWREAVVGQVKPHYVRGHRYELTGIMGLPLLHRRILGEAARAALSELILASLRHWEDGWEEVTIKKVEGHYWSRRVDSPLKHWLRTLPWLVDTSTGDHGLLRDPRPLHQRWFVPGSLLRGQIGRFRHLSPLSLPLARRLGDDEDLLEALVRLGLNVYPTEDARTGPALLETLAGVAETLADGAAAASAMPSGGFDVLLGQVRHGWKHLDADPEGVLPDRIIIRTKPRKLTVRRADELQGVYLPDHGLHTRLLREHAKPIVAMRPQEAAGPIGDRLVELGARRAAGLEEHCRIDHRPSAESVDGAQALDELGLGWLPVVLLALHAHGGGNPAGPATRAWQEAAARLRRARVRQCQFIDLELRDAGHTAARSEPKAHWLSRGRILVLHREIVQDGLYEEIAAASQAVLDRQDLMKDLRLVLGGLHGCRRPRGSDIEAALDRAEIDVVALADIRHRWDGETSTLVHRIRPVMRLLDVSDDGLDKAATDTAGLTEWLSKAAIPGWPTEELLTAARECFDDFEMGYRAWRVMGSTAELRKWNEAMEALGDKYEQGTNDEAAAQAKRHRDEAARLFRAFARHVATADAGVAIEEQGKLFITLNLVHESLEGTAEWNARCAEWSRGHWKVPFDAVLGVLRTEYEGVPRLRRISTCSRAWQPSTNSVRTGAARSGS